jgi:pimeloyl-ACP methyl ester carboxylesterase
VWTRRSVLAAGAATLALGACAKEDGMDVRAPSPPGAEDGIAISSGVPIHYVRLGDGPPVVLIHGASGNLRDWTFDVAPRLARDYTVIAFDRPGHGLSGWPARGGESLSVQAALMRGALAELGVERATLVGHSYGGSVALAWALDAPETVAALVLLAAPSQVWEGGLSWTTELLAAPGIGAALAFAAPRLVGAAFAQAAADSVFAPQEAPPGYVEHLGLGLLLRPETLRRNARQLTALKAQLREMVPRYPSLDMPVEILHGTEDTTVGLAIHSEPLARQIPQARLTRIKGAGHMIQHVALPELEAALARVAR